MKALHAFQGILFSGILHLSAFADESRPIVGAIRWDAWQEGAGIDYWAFCIYDDAIGLSNALRLYLNSPLKSRIHFALNLQGEHFVGKSGSRDEEIAILNQSINHGLNRYVPMSQSGSMGAEPYYFRSGFNGGITLGDDLRPADFPRELLRQGIAEGKRLRKYLLGGLLSAHQADGQHGGLVRLPV